MKKIFNILPVLMLVSCQLITEPNISTIEVYLKAPANDLETVVTNHTFWWDYVPDAEYYNLIIVSPNWDAVEVLVVDTNITENKFTINLTPGEYDWGVQAYNSSSSTDYFIRHISIDTTSNLGGQSLVLKAPSENNNTNEKKVKFEWYKILAADSYIFDIRVGDWQGASYIPQQIIANDTLSVILDEGIYEWGVTATNDFSSTGFTTRTLNIDLTPPAVSVITYPQYNGDSVNINAIRIAWDRSGTSVSPVSDSLFISTDTNFAEGSQIFSYLTSETEISLNDISSTGKYFCRLRSFDAAGNISASYSSVRTFYIKDEE